MKWVVGLAVLPSLLLTGCATSPSSVAPARISPTIYENYDCEQLTDEAHRVAIEAARATGVQQDAASRDAVAMGVATFIFWPALFMVGGDRGNSYYLAEMRGRMIAVEEASRLKNCNIQFAQR